MFTFFVPFCYICLTSHSSAAQLRERTLGLQSESLATCFSVWIYWGFWNIMI